MQFCCTTQVLYFNIETLILSPPVLTHVCILKRFGGREMDVQHLKNNLLKRKKQIKLLSENGMVLAFFKQFNLFYTLSGLLVMIYISG
jgi:hypothetical protein